MIVTWRGLDVLRGIGVFGVVLMHTAFFHFDGVWDIDFAHPPLVITVIGFLLMFAGLFAMVSGCGHTVRFAQRQATGEGLARTLASRAVAGLYVLVVAYAYFVFTGPGLVHFETQSWNQSILVELIGSGRFPGFSAERLLYVDSLVMIGSNAILIGLFLALGQRLARRHGVSAGLAGGAALVALLVSLARIPLYEVYVTALDQGDGVAIIGLNWLVNKNNPLLPYLAFGLFGSWVGLTLRQRGKGGLVRVVALGALLLGAGLVLYFVLPSTMLERSIDFTWYAIMVTQAGLFLLFVALAVWLYDLRPGAAAQRLGRVSRFFARFGVAGLTVYFLESLVSAGVFRGLRAVWPGLRLGTLAAVGAGVLFALAWGLALVLWERSGYRFGLERLYCRVMDSVGGSAKRAKLEAGRR